MKTSTKIVIVLIALYLLYHWNVLTSALATGAAGSPGGLLPQQSSVSSSPGIPGPGNRQSNSLTWPNLWGSQ